MAHDYALSRYGGLEGIRDLGMIESALARPYSGYYRPIEKKAAALVHSLTLNHGFVDGNKRTAVFVLFILLMNSGYTLDVGSPEILNEEVEDMVLAVAEHRFEFEDIVDWIKHRLVKLPPAPGW